MGYRGRHWTFLRNSAEFYSILLLNLNSYSNRIQGWVSGSRKSVSDETRQKPARNAGIYPIPAPEMPEMPETFHQFFSLLKIIFY